MKVILIAMIVFLITNCDKTFKVKLNNEDKRRISFSCGSVELVSRSLGKREFLIKQRFTNITHEAIVFIDSLRIEYNNQIIPYKITILDQSIESKSILLENESEIWLRFYIPGGIKDNHIITVIPGGYLFCNNKRVEIGNIHLSFQ